MKLLKVTTHDLQSPWGMGFQYVIDKKEVCGNFDTSVKKCAPGFYATDIEGLPYTFRAKRGDRVFDCEVGGDRKEFNPYRRRYSEFTLLDREYTHEELKAMAEAEEQRLGYRLSHAIFPVNPLEMTAPEVTPEIIALLKEWASVYKSVRDSAHDSVYNSVRESVGNSVWDSVLASVRAYIGWIFPNIKEWKYINHEPCVYPFESGAKLWLMGFVPSYDGITWRLHAGKNASVVYEINNQALLARQEKEKE